MPENLFEPGNAKPLAHELVECRRRGLDRLDFADHRQHRTDTPLLDQLAAAYCVAVDNVPASRSAMIDILMRDGVRACREHGYVDVSRFVAIAFFAKVEPHETTGKHKEGVQAIRRAKVMATFGLTEENYDTAQLLRFTDFAAFLLAFVAAAAAQRAGQQESVVPPVTDADPVEQPAGARAAVVGGLVLLLILALVVALLRQPAHRPSSAAATRTVTGSSGSAIGAPSGPTHPETAGEFGAPTFTDPHNPAMTGIRIAPYQRVQVSCRVYAPTIPSASPDGWWYRIASAPWNGRYYAIANTFMNGDTVGGPINHNTDFTVPVCPS